MHRRHFTLILLGCLLLMGSALSSWAIPANIHISGRLLDKNGMPVYYWEPGVWGSQQATVSLPAKVKFYDSATTTSPFIVVSATASAYDAFFNISLALPEAAVVKSSLWYTLSIDVDRNGLTSADDFPDRFEIGSVPFALSAKPQLAFTTHGGWTGWNDNFSTLDGTYPTHKMMVAPFETPAGGVEFNQMNFFLNQGYAGYSFSFGIYDKDGKQVVSSGLIDIKGADIVKSFLQVKHQKVKLQPSTIYYTAAAAGRWDFSFPQGLRPAAPTYGKVDIPRANGLIPTAFDPTKINPDTHAAALPITLILDESSGSSKPGWSNTKPGGPQYRWVIPAPLAKQE